MVTSERYQCPKCGEQEFEGFDWGFKCRNCGYEIQHIKELETGPLLKYINKPLQAIYVLPLIVYFYILLTICGYIVWDIYSMLHSNDMVFEISFLSRMVLYTLLSMALMDLTAIILERFVYPIFPGLQGDYKLERSAEEIKKEESRTRIYITTMVTMSVILILMHTFYKIFECSEVTMSLAVLIMACLFGSAAVLIAIGLWKKLDSESD
jgi:tRNA(Ile2) C34 agmatinyltransferase TiaS